MDSIELIRENLVRSRDRVLARVDEMRDHPFVAPTPRGGGHTLWVLGHLAYIEGLVVRQFMRGEPNPVADWAAPFDGDDVTDDAEAYPPFDDVLARCRSMRDETIAIARALTEADLDVASAACPAGFDDTFGTARHCLQYVADHFYMHRGQLADARRASGIDRMWL